MFHQLRLTSLVLTAAALLGMPATAGTSGGCELKPRGTAAVRVDGFGRVSIPVKLNGTPKYLVIDTDSEIGTLTWETVTALHLTPRVGPPSPGSSINHPDMFAVVQNFEMGQSTSRDLLFYIANDRGDLIAPDFSMFDVEFDFATGRMNVFEPSTCIEGPYWSNNGATAIGIEVTHSHLIRFPLMLDGKRVMAALDLAWDDNSIRRDVAEKLFGIYAATNSKVFHTLASEDGGVTIRNPAFDVVHGRAPDRSYDPPDIYLAIATLQHFHLYVAYRARKIFFTAASGPMPPSAQSLSRSQTLEPSRH